VEDLHLSPDIVTNIDVDVTALSVAYNEAYISNWGPNSLSFGHPDPTDTITFCNTNFTYSSSNSSTNSHTNKTQHTMGLEACNNCTEDQ
jgi:hypothetical protein